MEGPTTKQEVALLVEDLHYRYENSKREADALDGVSFCCLPGKIYGILGPNGSGKSTTFKVISTQLALQKGSVRVLGVDRVRDESALRKLIGVCFQSPSLDPLLTVEENLRVQGVLLGIEAQALRGAIDAWLAKLDLSSRRSERVATLSGGLARRVELVKSLLHQPKLLLLDEPTVGLDPVAREDFWNQLRALRDQGMCIVVTTHLMDEAELCDELLFMARGKCVAGGSPRQLKADFHREYVSCKVKDTQKTFENLRDRFSNDRVELLAGKIRVETKDPDSVLDVLRADYRDQLLSLEWDKATLGDIYRAKTGVDLS